MTRTNRQLLIASLMLSISTSVYSHGVLTEEQSAFFDALSTLCGETFKGVTDYPSDPDHDFAGKALVAEFTTCGEDEVRIAFSVGENRSRTWIISKYLHGLELRHDHRHEDGTPDEITMYGGWANHNGSPTKQFFPADIRTAQMIPAAATNVWMIEIDDQKGVLTYYLERNDQPRYRTYLKRTKQ